MIVKESLYDKKKEKSLFSVPFLLFSRWVVGMKKALTVQFYFIILGLHHNYYISFQIHRFALDRCHFVNRIYLRRGRVERIHVDRHTKIRPIKNNLLTD